MSADLDSADADLEALFDSIAKGVASAGSEPAAADHAATATPDTAATAPAGPVVAPADAEHPAGDVMNRIGHITRSLHDALRELGYDRLLEKTASAIPDARDRLAYVVKMTEQAAVRALNAIEVAQPIQDTLGQDAARLFGQWQRLFERQMGVSEFKQLAAQTRDYLGQVPTQTRATSEQLMEIMMAQDFQDLTGQVIKKITALAQDMEQQLVHLLVDMMPAQMRSDVDSGLLNGPVVNAEGRSDVVTSQNQVDDLLESLGF
jgi:chemotaxis protein CheZ